MKMLERIKDLALLITPLAGCDLTLEQISGI
jgi:hypothetical protein